MRQPCSSVHNNTAGVFKCPDHFAPDGFNPVRNNGIVDYAYTCILKESPDGLPAGIIFPGPGTRNSNNRTGYLHRLDMIWFHQLIY
jgi:hypothetical protein